VTSKDPDQFLPTSVQKSYFMLSRAVLDAALREYRPGRSEANSGRRDRPAQARVAADDVLPRVVIREVEGAEVLTSYTR
jgi:hypothetical protein